MRILARALGLILGIAVLVFLLVRVIPGDVVDVMNREGGLTEAQAAEIRAELGLAASLPAQFLAWTGQALQGDLGLSLRFRRPVADLILHALPVTLWLTAMSFAVGLVLGVGAALAAILRPVPSAGLVHGLNLWSIAVPTFCAGLGAILVFVLWLGWLPLLGNYWLPTLIVGVDIAGQLAKPLHEDLKESLSANFIRTARAKGVHPVWIVWRHLLPNALTVVLALSGVILAGLIGGTLTMEVLFGLSGIGKLALDSVLGRDYPLIQAVVVVLASAVVLINALTEATARWLDPRLRL